MTAATILQQAVGRPITYDADGDKPWTSAIVKTPTPGRLALGSTQLDGDGQADLRHHGGPDKAVLAYAASHYDAWAPEHDFPWGGFGENWTVAGHDEDTVFLGDIYTVGTATVQVSQPRQPCWKLNRRWQIKGLALEAQNSGRLGWYYRVLSTGHVQVGDIFTLVERPLPDWPLARLNALMHRDKQNRADAAFLAECGLLAESWRATFRKRAAGDAPPSDAPRLDGARS
ncbi:MAG: MOSC domain-containing protein, partial [Acidobacteriota bacterium]